jgi:hypothetical protein
MRVVLAGWLLCLTSIVVGGLAAERSDEVAPLAAGGFVVGCVLFWSGGHASARASGVGDRLKWMKEKTDGWNVAPELDSWQAATTAQLRAVEDIADDHGGVAFVCGDAIGVVQVLARRGLRVHRLWVDEIATVAWQASAHGRCVRCRRTPAGPRSTARHGIA